MDNIGASLTSASVPIYGLPDEVLTIIMVHCQQPLITAVHSALDEPGPEIKECFSWMAITQVSQRLRQISLSTPSLWRTIYLPQSLKFPGTLALTFFKRSRPLLIDLDDRSMLSTSAHDMDSAQLDLFYEKLKENSRVLRTLHLRGLFWNRTAQLVLKHEMPNLSSLLLDSHAEVDIYGLSADVPRINHQLHQLSLKFFVWPRNGFSQVSYLFLSDELGRRSSHVEFLQALEVMSDTLESLSLINAGPVIRHPSECAIRSYDNRIVMRSLRYVEIMLHQEHMCGLLFLHSLSLPETTKIVWSASLSYYAGEHLPSNLPPSVHLATVKRLVLREEEREEIILDAATLSLPFVDYYDNTLDELIKDMQKYIPNVEEIVYAGSCLSDAPRDFLEYQSVTSIHTTMDQVGPLVDALEDMPSPALLPKLSSLIIHTGLSSTTSINDVAPWSTTDSDNLTSERSRRHLGTTYAIRFVPSDLSELGADQPF